MQAGLKVVRLLALVVWVGGLIFFAFVVAPVAFGTLPTSHEAGLVVGASLRVLHWIGLICGLLYLLSTIPQARQRSAWIAPTLVALMMVLTAVSQWGILPRMEVDRAAAGGDIAAVDAQNAARLHFEWLHKVSERVEGGVLLLGLGATILLGVESDPKTLEERF